MDIDNRIKDQTALSLLYKIVGIVVSFLFVPILLNFLGKEDYGIWVTITSILTWFTVVDFGIGLGLRNILTKSLAICDFEKSRIYISSAYFILFIIFTVLMFALLIISKFLNWNLILNITKYSNLELLKIIQIAIVGFCMLFIFKIINNLYYAIHQPSTNGLIQTITQICILIVLLMIGKSSINYSNLFSISLIYMVFPIIILFLFTILFFWKRKNLRPGIRRINIDKGMDISRLGLKFLMLQLSAIILNTILPFLITKFMGTSTTAEFNISIKYFGIVQMVVLLVLNPYWSAVTHKFAQKEFNWIRISLRKTMLWSSIGALLIVVASLFAPVFFKFWVGENVVELKTIYWCAFFIGSFIITQPVITFINGIGLIQQQMYFSIAIIILVIPADLILYKYLSLGLGSFLIPPIFFRLLRAFFGFFQLKRILT